MQLLINNNQGSRVRPNFSMVRLKKIRFFLRRAVREKKKVSATLKISLWFNNRQTHIRPISWSKPIRDSEGRTPPLIGRGPDIPVRVCTFENVCAAVRQREVSSRDGRYLLFYFRSDIDIFKPSIVDIDTDTCKLKLSFKLLKEYNQ